MAKRMVFLYVGKDKRGDYYESYVKQDLVDLVAAGAEEFVLVSLYEGYWTPGSEKDPDNTAHASLETLAAAMAMWATQVYNWTGNYHIPLTGRTITKITTTSVSILMPKELLKKNVLTYQFNI